MNRTTGRAWPSLRRALPGVRGIALTLLAVATAATGTLRAQASFTNVSDSIGFSGTRMGSNNDHGLGVTWLDFDADGWEDLFVPNGKGYVKELYRNRGDGTFELRNDLLPSFDDVEFMGAIAGDYDNDGDVDLYVFTDHEDRRFNGGPHDGPRNLLLQNQRVESGGVLVAPLFVDVATAAGVDDEADPALGPDYPGHRSAIGGFLDYDRDGWLDLYVGHWCMPARASPDVANLDHLYRNQGDGTFVDVTGTVGLPLLDDPQRRVRPTLGFLAAHLNADLWPDLYVGHSGMTQRQAIDQLYLHDGVGSYLDGNALSPGIGDDATANMGIVTSDIDNDGDFDLYMSDLPVDFDPNCNPLYLNHGDGTFTDDQAAAAGITADRSWAVIFLDCDHDGFEDLFVGTMAGAARDNYFFMNNGDLTFRDESKTAGVRFEGDSKGGAKADYDHDGDLDLAWVDSYSAVWNQGGLRFLRNDTPKSGNWIEVRLVATASNRSAIGARLTACVGGMRLLRQVVGGAGAHGQDSLDVHFGFPAATTVDQLKIEWPSGAVNVWRDLPADQLHILTEQVDDHLGLVAEPADVAGGETLTLTTTGGAPGMLALLAVVDVDGVPTFIDLDLGTLDPAGVRAAAFDVPPGCFSGLDVGFQAIAFESWSGQPGWSSVARVMFQ